MYNGFMKYLLSNDPDKTVSEKGMKLRKLINPAFKSLIPLSIRQKIKVQSRAKMPDDRPIIFASTHGFREDVEAAVVAAGKNKHAYILIGSLKQVFHAKEGIYAWINGTVLVDRTDPDSRAASKDKMRKVLSLGGNIIMYPEGTWNISPNKLVAGLFPGVYDTAKEAGALVAPIASHRVGNVIFARLGKAFDITKFERQEGIRRLRDKLATLKWRIYETLPVTKRSTLPQGEEADRYWEQTMDDLRNEVSHFEHELERMAIFRPKDIFHRDEVFEHIKELLPGHNTAFLFNKKLI